MKTSLKQLSLFLVLLLTIDGIYSIQITTINGADKSLSVFQGKKILVVVLPTSQRSQDSAFLKTIDSIAHNYSSSLSVIGVPSFEFGYNAENARTLRHFYNGLLGQRVTITEGMYVRKTSPMQHELFRWLTRKEKNVHFDEDVEGIGEKFFINEGGDLYAIVGPNAILTQRLLQKLL